jgi:hypothetical protein
LGEGAYGSVHPARLAATGEKVGKGLYCTMLYMLSRVLHCIPLHCIVLYCIHITITLLLLVSGTKFYFSTT